MFKRIQGISDGGSRMDLVRSARYPLALGSIGERPMMRGFCGAVLAAILIAGPVRADDAAHAQLAGRTLDVVVAASNTSAGARLWNAFAAELRRILPDTLIRARFNDAGSGVSAAREVFAAAPGSLTIGFVRPPALAFAQSQGHEEIDFDLGRAHWIISTDKPSVLMAARRDLPLDLATLRGQAKQPITAVNDITDIQAIAAFIFNALTGLDARVVVGFDNASRLRAIVAGEIDFYALSIDKDVTGLLDGNEISSLFTITGSDFPDSVDHSRTLESVVVAGAPKPVIDYVEAAWGMGRSFYAAPGVTPEDVAALRSVFEEVMADPEFIAEAKAQKLILELGTGDEVEAMMDTLLLTDPTQKAAVEHAFACGRAMSDGTLKACNFGS